MKEIPVQEFVRRIKKAIEESTDSKFTFFLGAGASHSSGIPLAGRLVRRWLPELKELKTGSRDDWEEWANE